MAGLTRTRGDLMKVGVFVAIALLLLVGGLLWLAGSSLLRPVARYTVVFADSVSGLNAGASVQYQGVVIGRVADIRLTGDLPPKVAVDIEVEPGTPVRADTRAQLVGSLVTGIKFIELTGGTEQAARIDPGGTIVGDTASLDAFRDQLAEIADRVLVVLRRFDENVFTDERAAEFGAMIGDLAAVSKQLAATMEGFRAEQTGSDIATLVRRMQDLVTNVNAVVRDFHARSGDFYGDVQTTLRDLDRTVNASRELVVRATDELEGTGGSVAQVLTQLAGAIARLQETLDLVQSNPSMLLFGRSIPEREFER